MKFKNLLTVLFAVAMFIFTVNMSFALPYSAPVIEVVSYQLNPYLSWFILNITDDTSTTYDDLRANENGVPNVCSDIAYVFNDVTYQLQYNVYADTICSALPDTRFVGEYNICWRVNDDEDAIGVNCNNYIFHTWFNIQNEFNETQYTLEPEFTIEYLLLNSTYQDGDFRVWIRNCSDEESWRTAYTCNFPANENYTFNINTLPEICELSEGVISPEETYNLQYGNCYILEISDYGGVTALSYDWLFNLQEEEIPEEPETGYQATYETSDFISIFGNGLGIAGSTFVGFIPMLIMLVVLGLGTGLYYVFKRFK